MTKIIITIALSCCLYACNQSNTTDTNTYVIERIIDGDTFIADGVRIRLWGIDAPEKGENLSLASTLYLETLLSQGQVDCKFKHQDRYKRDVMQCFVDGHDVASDLVKFGLATDYKRYSKGHYQFEEDFAKKKRVGIWKHSTSDEI